MFSANIPVGYYGNSVGVPYSISKSKHLKEMPLAFAVELVKAAKNMMSSDYFRSMIESNMVVQTSLALGEGFLGVSDIRFLGEIDFGWGSPVYATSALNPSGICYLSKYRNLDGSECTIAVVNFREPVMMRFEQELKKITAANSLSKL